jgi:pilus assembly protein CpaB
MTNFRSVLISLLCAIFALIFIFAYISKREKALLELTSPMKVVVATRDIPQGSQLTSAMLQEKEVPASYVQPGAYSSEDEIIDRFVAVPVLKASQIVNTNLSQRSGAQLAQKIPKGMRAFSISASMVSAVANLIRTGDYVDILITAEIGSINDQGGKMLTGVLTKTVVENVLVLAVDQQSSNTQIIERPAPKEGGKGTLFSNALKKARDNTELKTLTLALNPESVQMVALAQEIGSVYVSLRSSWDSGDPSGNKTLYANELLDIEQQVLPKSIPAWTEIRGSESRIHR